MLVGDRLSEGNTLNCLQLSPSRRRTAVDREERFFPSGGTPAMECSF